jgi:hypothetical protein
MQEDETSQTLCSNFYGGFTMRLKGGNLFEVARITIASKQLSKRMYPHYKCECKIPTLQSGATSTKNLLNQLEHKTQCLYASLNPIN